MTGTSDEIQTIRVIHGSLPAGVRWQPHAGDEAVRLLDEVTLSDEERRLLRDESIAILGKCAPPDAQRARATGLVIGYIQSGKTMSFTTVSALARDNGYRIVIVIAGTSLPLFRQSEDRLKADLDLLERFDRKWRHFSNPDIESRQTIEAILTEWQDPSVPTDERQTILVTVMKHHQRLANLNRLLGALDLVGVPVLVIDDEADHTGLNARVNDNEMSTTYARLMMLRGLLPHHAYLQYTATPQAPLLINVIDALSPDFAELLTPGLSYTGGQRFFSDLEEELVRTIPLDELERPEDDSSPSPPPSLHEAMRIFFVGVAAGMRDKQTRNRSMMLHPSQYRQSHSEYRQWVDAAKDHWERVLRAPEDEPSRQALVEQFRRAHEDLTATVRDLPPFEDLLSLLPRAIMKTNVETVNSGGRAQRTPEIDWRGNYAWILVGGQAMDRGFTVEGLTVTYMPRSVGVGNADTIQQRARFFGYKEAYLGYCRVFLEPEARRAYTVYVDHEKELREQLERHRKEGRSLKDWKRAFFLDSALSPTRRNVLNLEYDQGVLSDAWYDPKAPHDNPQAVEFNRKLVDSFLSKLQLVPDEGHGDRTAIQRHTCAGGLELRRVYRELLVEMRVPRLRDSIRWTGLLLQVQRYLEDHPQAMCTIYKMSDGAERERAVDGDDELKNLFQGAHPDRTGVIYPGDRAIRVRDELTIQVHNLSVVDGEGSSRRKLADGVRAMAVWVPAELGRDWLVQHEQKAVAP